MDGAGKLISWAIGLALALASVGELPRATLWMAKMAAGSGPQLISLGKLNRALIAGAGQHRQVKTSQDSKRH